MTYTRHADKTALATQTPHGVSPHQALACLKSSVSQLWTRVSPLTLSVIAMREGLPTQQVLRFDSRQPWYMIFGALAAGPLTARSPPGPPHSEEAANAYRTS
jgi:hypothetical protein